MYKPVSDIAGTGEDVAAALPNGQQSDELMKPFGVGGVSL